MSGETPDAKALGVAAQNPSGKQKTRPCGRAFHRATKGVNPGSTNYIKGLVGERSNHRDSEGNAMGAILQRQGGRHEQLGFGEIIGRFRQSPQFDGQPQQCA
jgi:hypothetical protein